MINKISWLQGKTALITGGAKRIGQANALALAAAGVNVVIHYRHSETAAKEVVAAVEQLGVKAWALQADLAQPAEAEALFPTALQLAGPLQILVNNASIFEKSRFSTFTLTELHENIQVNAFAPLQIARAFAQQKQEGAIINFLDSYMQVYDREHAAYHLSKRMFFSLTRMMALEFAPLLRVNAVAPGLILPPAGEDASFLTKLAHTNPLNQVGTLKGITDAVLFLLESEFITGQVIFVDGGYHMKGQVYG